jgi:hypothetical protein
MIGPGLPTRQPIADTTYMAKAAAGRRPFLPSFVIAAPPQPAADRSTTAGGRRIAVAVPV